jgi:hypothetical protein
MQFVLSALSALFLVSCATAPETLRESQAQADAQAATKVAAAKDCSDDSFCTREYLPTICQFQGQSFEGSNPCEAKKLIRRFACEKDLKYTDADLSCKSKDEPVIEAAPAAPAKKGKGK